MDQSLFAAPHSLSQRTTSFIASRRQGIHRMPFLRLIALIIDVRPIHPDRTPPTKDQYRKSSISRRSGTGTNGKKPGPSRNCNPGPAKPVAAHGKTGFPVLMDNSSLHDVRSNAPRPGASTLPEPAKQVFLPDKDDIQPPPQSLMAKKGWWSQTGSNRRPPACKAGALPAELWPLMVPEARNHKVHSGLSRRQSHPRPWLSRHQARRPGGLADCVGRYRSALAIRSAEAGKPDRAPALTGRSSNQNGGLGWTRTTGLTLIRRTL